MDLLLRTKKDPNNPADVGQPDLFWGQGTNDLIVRNGDFALTDGIDNLEQSMAKILVTERGTNTFTPLYGSNLQNFIGQGYTIDVLRANVQTEIIDTLRIYQFINKDNPDLNEQIETLRNLKIDASSSNGITVSLAVVTRAGVVVGSLVSVQAT